MKDLNMRTMGHFFCLIRRGGGDILVKVTESDLQLLKRYAHNGAESAFEEIIQT